MASVTTNKIDKLHSNFPSDFLDQYKVFKEGDVVTFTVTLLGIENTKYFYKLTVKEKLEYVLKLKDIAGKFFKQGNYKKAAKVYQKINGFYNFGDAENNHAKENQEDEEWKKANEELMSLKIVCFTNLVVCKFKTKEYTSVIGITDQILEMDPNHCKALFFRGKSEVELQEYDKAVNTLTKLC